MNNLLSIFRIYAWRLVFQKNLFSSWVIHWDYALWSFEITVISNMSEVENYLKFKIAKIVIITHSRFICLQILNFWIVNVFWRTQQFEFKSIVNIAKKVFILFDKRGSNIFGHLVNRSHTGRDEISRGFGWQPIRFR